MVFQRRKKLAVVDETSNLLVPDPQVVPGGELGGYTECERHQIHRGMWEIPQIGGPILGVLM